jgi:hypothetical protein
MDRTMPDTHSRLRSGEWVGHFLDPRAPGQHPMELTLAFHSGRVLGEGHDEVGPFTIEGRYTGESGECVWSKRYESHEVVYRGYAEEGTIWGTWRIRDSEARGGFQLWPAAGAPRAEGRASCAAHAEGVGRDL